MWKIDVNENYRGYYPTGLRAGYYRTDRENGILCAGNSFRKSEDAQEIDLSYMDPAQRVIDYVKIRQNIFGLWMESYPQQSYWSVFISTGKTVQSDRKAVRWRKEKIKSASGTGDIPEFYFVG